MGARGGGGTRAGMGGPSMMDIIGARTNMAKALGEFKKAKDERMRIFFKGKIDDRLVAANKTLEAAQAKFGKAQKAYNKKVAAFTKAIGGPVEGVEPSNIDPWEA